MTPKLAETPCRATRRAVLLFAILGFPLVAAAVGRGTFPQDDGAASVPSVRQDDAAPPRAGAESPDQADTASGATTAPDNGGSPIRSSPREFYRLWTLAPAIVAILLAMLTRQVVAALAVGIMTGAGMMVWHQQPPAAWQDYLLLPVRSITTFVETYLLGVLWPVREDLTKGNYRHLQVVLFTLLIGAMVGVIEANGGTRAMVARVTRFMRTRRSGQLGAFGAGMVVFFDDYASTMIVGPSMRPVFDRLRISRQKLAYIVDSTAAPIASVMIGTWLAAEISYLDEGIGKLGAARPAFLAGVTGSAAFWASIPYRTYALLALFLVFLVALTGRDFGSMRRAESAALAGTPEDRARGTPHAPGAALPAQPSTGSRAPAAEVSADESHWLLGFLPVFVLIVMTIALLVRTGIEACEASGKSLPHGGIGECWGSLKTLIGEADSYYALQYSAFAGALVAVLLSMRTISFARTMEAFSGGMTRMFTALIILVLAWGLAQVTDDLELGKAAAAYLQSLINRELFDIHFLPTAVFLTSCVISFATGTSWGTMGVMVPTVIAITAHLLAGLPQDQALHTFYWCVGSVLAGAVFGDHCSPISDTTVMSAMFSDCDLGAHVWTQMPYALTVAIVSILCPDLLEYGLKRHAPDFYGAYWNVYLSLGCGALLLLLIVLVVGRRPRGVVAEHSFRASPAP